MIKTIASIIGLLASAQIQVSAATITPYQYRDGNSLLFVSGDLEAGDDARFQAQLEAADRIGIHFLAIALSSLGGQVDAGWGMAKIIRTRQLSTVVGEDQKCMSACFYLFAAGVNRFAGARAQIGVHSAAINGQENPYTKALTLDKARQLFTELNVPYSIIGALVTTAPGAIYTLNKEELASMGVGFLATPVQQTTQLAQIPAPPAPTFATVEHSRAQGRSFNDRGLDLARNGTYTEAVKFLEQAATVSPFDPEILANLGFVYYKVGQMDNADAALKISARLSPTRAITWQNLGLVAVARAQGDVAVAYFVRYLQTDRAGGPARRQLQQWASDESLPALQRTSAALALGAVAAQLN